MQSQQARALRLEVAAAIDGLPAEDQRQMLLRWIEADLEGAPRPQGNLPFAPEPSQLRTALDAAAGVSAEADVSPEMLMAGRGLNVNLLAPDGEDRCGVDETSEEMFLSHYLGPALVAFAIADPKAGEGYLKEYFGVHAAYSYAYYRFGSSWALLRPILQHPEPDWVMAKVRALLCCAIGGGSGEFEEGLPLTVLALRVAGGDAEAAKKAAEELAKLAARFVQEASELGPGRGRGDTWGRYKRLLATLAQVQAIAGADVGVSGHDLLNNAIWIHYGNAGYQAPACLALAESIRICHPPEEQWWVGQSLESAQAAAHHIQEGTFCARTTARVNAMRRQWWPGSDLNVRAEIAALRADPHAVRFASLHYVNHSYQGRGDPPQSFPLPNRVRYATTLLMLADAYQRGQPEFLRLNREWEPGQPIPPGTPVNVPDPGMAPLLAARLAAETLVVTKLSKEERAALIRSLVPVAAANPTTLDAVLARLLLAEQPNSAILEKLAELAPMPVDSQQDDLQAKLTVVTALILRAGMAQESCPPSQLQDGGTSKRPDRQLRSGYERHDLCQRH